MDNVIETIQLTNLTYAFIPVIMVLVILWKWRINRTTSVHAIARMVLQLLLIGYFLAYIFEAKSSWIIILVLVIMLLSSSWISLRTAKISKQRLFLKSLCAIFIGGGITLYLVTQRVLNIEPWFQPNYMVPLAGMIFANAMNSISLAVERLESEMDRQMPFDKAKIIAFEASLIPITNSLFAVGLVSLPGMMTGQILSGVSPFIAARYQIMVMCMVFGSAGISSAIFLTLIKKHFISQVETL